MIRILFPSYPFIIDNEEKKIKPKKCCLTLPSDARAFLTGQRLLSLAIISPQVFEHRLGITDGSLSLNAYNETENPWK